MDLLKKCQELYEELKTIDDALTFLENKLSNYEESLLDSITFNPDEYEDNYREQFKMAMNLVNCYQDLQDALDVLEKDDNMAFFVKRMRKNSADLLKVEVINVPFDV